MMGSFIQAIRFLLAVLRLQKVVFLPSDEFRLLQDNQGRTFKTDFYFPKKRARGVILIMHGMNKYGKNDVRIRVLARGYADIGYIAVVPEFSAEMRFDISMLPCEEMVRVFQMIFQQPELQPFSKIAVFCISFIGCQMLRVLGRPEICDRFSSVLILGGADDPQQCLQTLLSPKVKDVYARLVTMRSMMNKLPNPDAFYLEALLVAIDDQFVFRDDTQFKRFLASAAVYPEQKEQAWTLLNAAKSLEDIMRNIKRRSI